MAFTQTDLDNIDTAIVALATGTRVGSVTIGDHLIKYADTTLDAMRSLRQIVKADVEAAAANWSPRTFASNGGRGE